MKIMARNMRLLRLNLASLLHRGLALLAAAPGEGVHVLVIKLAASRSKYLHAIPSFRTQNLKRATSPMQCATLNAPRA